MKIIDAPKTPRAFVWSRKKLPLVKKICIIRRRRIWRPAHTSHQHHVRHHRFRGSDGVEHNITRIRLFNYTMKGDACKLRLQKNKRPKSVALPLYHGDRPKCKLSVSKGNTSKTGDLIRSEPKMSPNLGENCFIFSAMALEFRVCGST